MAKKGGKQVEVVPEVKEPEFIVGTGEFTFTDGSQYLGEWKEMQGRKFREGQGTFINGKEKYVGSWVDDKMHGNGEYFFGSGSVYRGSFVNNLFHGEGEYTFPDGAKYTGSWSNNKMHGVGTYVDNDNNIFKGRYNNGLYDSGDGGYLTVRPIN